MIEKNASILIVEDDEDDYIIAKDCLEELVEYNFIIDWVTTPDQALAQLKLNRHDICLLDYQLGALTGLTVLEKAAEIECRIPIIMLTGQSDTVLDKAALDAGAVDFVVKNEFNSPRFARSIRYAIARQEVEKERLERINAETQSRSKDRFLAHLSHELRTPLTSILGYTELLLESDKASPAHSELNIIFNNSKHLLSLLNNVLDLSKIAAKKLELNPSTFNLDNFLADIFTLMHVTAEDKGIELRFRCKTPVPLQMHVDPTRLRQILINLIHNAIKFTTTGYVEISISAQMKLPLCQLIFEVRDTGTGIPAEKLERIFEPFEQGEDIVSRQEIGAGLGLAISSELAIQLGGGIQVESNVGEGSCFTLTVVTDINTQNQFDFLTFKKSVYKQDNNAIYPLSGKILVVDDLYDIRLLIGHIVKSFGLDVEFASNGQEALEKIAQCTSTSIPYSAVIMDIHMPVMDGKTAIAHIRKSLFTHPVIALTAATMKGVEEELKTLGFDEVLPKPIDKGQLYDLLSTLLPSGDFNSSNNLSPSTDTGKPPPLAAVMLIEDDKDAAEITKLLLASMNINVDVAHNAEECLTLLATKPHWHKILLDVHLPDANGLILANIIRETASVDSIIIISGEHISQQLLDEHHCNNAVLKPLNKEKLRSLFDLNLA
ncbi:response regulator [Alteromonadaceae bacterium BrNp21-10]|nr:response regulator [Alteromonadaceae bacterium BrNp21-10]